MANDSPISDNHETAGPVRAGAPPTLRSPLVPLVIAACVLTIPTASAYVLLRRCLVTMHHKIDELSTHTKSLERQFSAQTALLETSAKREEHLRLRSRLEEAMREISKLRRQSDTSVEARTLQERAVSEQLRQLREERERDREQLAVFRELGISLADIAAFMHEVDIRQGFWTQRTDNGEIERIRQIALKLQSIPGDNPESDQSSSTTSDAHHL